MLKRTIQAFVDIEVGKAKKAESDICPQCGKKLGTNPNCFNCILNAHVVKDDMFDVYESPDAVPEVPSNADEY